ncbi:polysaccharide pyruvyl transferase family protein [Brucella pseudogrignonensis]|uniref:polysaccharide pyruvyl transferase family protein n=1 Tax=Brucella pseudogrignonensis TaxID=419475 RepID=UPI00178C451A|nr:polysaccharide pyruvyl transferase family protein [Brucella pseudogrignonensis]
MPNLLTLNGGGAIVSGNGGYTAALPFSDRIEHFRNGDVNTGDLLVFDAILKQLKYKQVRNIQVKEGVDSLYGNYNYDISVLRGSNYITEAIDLGYMNETLKKIDTPIIPIGLGVQAPHYKKLSLHKGTVEALHILADKCKTIGVRGNYSAEILNGVGIKNIRVIGCPSFYRSGSPKLRIKKMSYTRDMNIGFTLNKYLWGEYASDWIKSLRLQRSLFLQCINHKSSVLYSQGEREETLSTLVIGEEKQQQLDKIKNQFELGSTKEIESFLSSRIYSPFTIDDWSNHVSQNADFMIGFRLHGNVIALHQGIPSVYFAYDSRIRELTSLFGLPTIDIEQFRPVVLSKIVEEADFSSFEASYEHNYKNYCTFLSENGLSHNLKAPTAVDDYVPPKDIINEIRVDYDTPDAMDWIKNETSHLSKWVQDLDFERRRVLRTDAVAEKAPLKETRRSIFQTIYNKIAP